MPHPDKTCLGDRVLYFSDASAKGKVALVIRTHDDDPHMGCLAYYCPESHAWKEAYNVKFGMQPAGPFFLNTEG